MKKDYCGGNPSSKTRTSKQQEYFLKHEDLSKAHFKNIFRKYIQRKKSPKFFFSTYFVKAFLTRH